MTELMFTRYNGEMEQQPPVETLVVLDIDRTLIRTTELFEHTKEIIYRRYALSDELIREMELAEKNERNNAFDFVSWLAERTGIPDLQNPQMLAGILVDGFCDESGHMSDEFARRILIDGVDDLLESIDAINATALLMTAGGIVQQEVKIRLLQQYVREKNQERDEAAIAPLASIDQFMIIDNSKQRKAELLSEAFAAGEFSEEILLSHASAQGALDGTELIGIRRAIVIDDKEINIANAGPNVEGWLALKDGEAADDNAPRHNSEQSLHELALRMRGY